ncbi:MULTISPECIES: nuclear transport factor 2 family protein [Saliphagus]|uniref:Nuclear transport factor 2 family protein n=1 Tax=Saliphagus infecundisoli TaxID=1849069 RepID=A0ABD5QA84_9EURY|nr:MULTISPECIES: nuclear transport factor 2 family protein [Saliphagus]
MSDSDRDDLIDAYFDAMDEADLERVRPVLADDFVYESLAGDLEGAAGLETYLEEVRGLSNTSHQVTLRAHGEDASVAEGVVTGDGDDGRVEAGFCDVFEFDDADERIVRIGVYLNDS